MRSVLILIALLGTAHADKFPASGPCEDAEACEKACAANKKGTCYWGGVLLLQSAVDETAQSRAQALFDRACTKGDGEACWQAANLVWHQESRESGDGSKARAAFQRACNKNHARACWRFSEINGAATDPKLKKLVATSRAKGLKLLEQKCTKTKWPKACGWVAAIYESGDNGVKADATKAAAFRDRRCLIDTGSKCPPPPPPAPPPRPRPPMRGGAE
jgi:uncharacterized protein